MNLSVLVSTMYDEINLYNKMNIQGSAVIVNQGDSNSIKKIKLNNNNLLKFISSTERGISKSRNLAIKNSKADICLLADNDVVLKKDYIEIILDAYIKYPDADIIAFTVESKNPNRPIHRLKNGKVNRIKSMKIMSKQISFKREIISKENLYLNEKFGTGSKKFNSGEETIFLYQAIKKGLNVYFVDKKIATASLDNSTWYGKDPRKELLTKGAAYYHMSSFLYPLFNLQFAVRRFNLYEGDFTFVEVIKILFEGTKEGKKIVSKEESLY